MAVAEITEMHFGRVNSAFPREPPPTPQEMASSLTIQAVFRSLSLWSNETGPIVIQALQALLPNVHVWDYRFGVGV